MRAAISTFLFLIILSNHVFAQSDSVAVADSSRNLKMHPWIIHDFVNDEVELFSSPFHMSKHDLNFWIPVVAATGISIYYDEKIFRSIIKYRNENEWVKKSSPIITDLGEGYTGVAISGLFLLNGLAFKNEKSVQTGNLIISGLGHAGIIVSVGKMIFCRQRPSVDHGRDHWNWFPSGLHTIMNSERTHNDAFPSGHTITAFTVATVIAEQYKSSKIVSVLAYTSASLVGLSRITESTHWMSDVILGGALGYGIGKYMVRKHHNTHWTWLPFGTSKDASVTLSYNF